MLCLIDHRKVKKPLPWKDLLVEIGFGGGDFILMLSSQHPERHILGFELSGIAIEKLTKRVKREGVKNVHCVRMDAYWGFYFLLGDSSVERIYMNYPDPWFKKRDVKRRLTTRERLYLFSRKLRPGGEIVVRTDHLPFAEFSIEEADSIGGFEHTLSKLSVDQPLTKYEKKWLSLGKELYELTLRKTGEPREMELPRVKEVERLFPVKVKGTPEVKALENREFKLGERVYLKLFRSYSGEDTYLLEVLLSEEGFVQRFFVQLRERGEGWVVDVSPHSEVLRTENIQRAVELVAREAFKP